MQFSCGQCSTRYAVPDDKVRGKRIRTKCRKCGAEIVVDGVNVGSAPFSAAPAPTASAAKTHPKAESSGTPGRVEEPWTVAISRSDQRKMLTAEVVEAYSAGTITDTTLVWKNGMQRWQPPFDIPAIALALLARGLEPRPRTPDQRAKTEPPPADTSPATDWDDEATRVFDAAVVAEDFVAPKQVVKPPASSAPAVTRAPPATSSSPTAARSAPAASTPKIAKHTAPSAPVPTAGVASSETSPASDWDDENEATKMLAPNRALLAARLPRRQGAAKPSPGALRSRPPPVPPRRSTAPPLPSKPPAPRSIPPPAPLPPLTPSPTKSIGEERIPTVRPPPGTEVEDPFAFEDEATAVITADRARALLEEQLDKQSAPPPDETPLSFGTSASSAEPPVVAATTSAAQEPIIPPRAKRESLKSFDDLVEKGPTIVVSEPGKRVSSIPPPKPKSPVPPPDTRVPSEKPAVRDFGGIQHERTRVVRARRKPSSPMFWLALAAALAAAASAGYYASRLLDPSRPAAPQRP